MTRNAKHIAQLPVRMLIKFVDFSNFVGLCVRKLGFWVAFSFGQGWQSMSSILCKHVQGVVLGCSKEKVIRIDAKPVVAFMADKKTFWNWALKKSPSQSMGLMANRPISPVFVGLESTITRSGFGAVPVPAGFCFIKFFDETLLDAFAFHCHRSLF